jgi:hypothetical protein
MVFVDSASSQVSNFYNVLVSTTPTEDLQPLGD